MHLLLDKKFKALSDEMLTCILIGLGLVLIAIAVFSHNAVIKAVVAAWVILP